MDNEYDQNGWDADDAVYDSEEDQNVAFDEEDDEAEVEEEQETEKCRPARKVEIVGDDRIMNPIMTDFEKSNVIAARAKQIDRSLTFKHNGRDVLSKVMDQIKAMGLTSSREIAEYEFNTGNLPPYKYYRRNYNGTYEVWRHEDFLYFPK